MSAVLAAEAAAESDLPSESARAYARALTRLRTPLAVTETRPDLDAVRHWIARLVTPAAAVGLRSEAAVSEPMLPQQRIFETEEHVIPLWEERSRATSGSYVIGQVYGKRDSVALIPETVLFTAADGTIHEARLEEGEFHVDGLASGTYVLQCWLSGDTDSAGVVVLPGIWIGEPDAAGQ